MKISVITAVRNAANDVERTLESISSQTHPDIEHIVIDGASTDGTVDVIRKLGQRVAKLLSEPDLGIYDAFNKGLSLASGEAVAFLGAGDTYAANDVVARVAGLLNDATVDAVFGDLLILDPSNPERVIRRYSSARFSPRRLRFGFMPAHPTLFLRRRIYTDVGAYNPTYRIAGDFELCVRAFIGAHATYRYLPRVLVRMHGGGASNSGWKSKWIITREMHRACRENNVDTSLLRLLARFPSKFFELTRRGG